MRIFVNIKNVKEAGNKKPEEALFKSKGEDVSSVAKSDLAKRFNVNESTIHEAFNDLKKID